MTTVFDYIPQVLDRAVEDAQPIDVKGKVIQVVGTIIKASVPGVKIGEVCLLRAYSATRGKISKCRPKSSASRRRRCF